MYSGNTDETTCIYAIWAGLMLAASLNMSQEVMQKATSFEPQNLSISAFSLAQRLGQKDVALKVVIVTPVGSRAAWKLRLVKRLCLPPCRRNC